MALPFLNGSKESDCVVAIDLGGHATKAVELRRAQDKYVLGGYAVMDAPTYPNGFSIETLAGHLRAVTQTLGAKTKEVSIALNVNDSMLRQAELPQMPVGDMRQLLKVNSKVYLQQDLAGHLFDCYITAPPAAKDQDKKTSMSIPKLRVLVGGAKQQLVEDVQAAARAAGLTPETVMPGLICPVNAFELAMPAVFTRESIALVDFGFFSTSICVLQDGNLVLSRVVSIGGNKLTTSLSETMGISYAEAESIKVGIPAEVQSTLESSLLPLSRELRASIDCFEHQQDKPVSQVFVTGGSAKSEYIVQLLQTELMLECKTWNPLGFVELGVRPEQAPELEQTAPRLASAIGAAVAAL